MDYYLSESDKRQVKALLEDAKRRHGSNARARPPAERRGRNISIKWNGEEKVPRFGVVACTSTESAADDIQGPYLATCEQPSTTFRRVHLVNGPVPIPAGSYSGPSIGMAQNDEFLLVKYDTGTPATGETWGPKPGQFTVSKNYPGFRCLGVIDATNKVMLAVPEPPPFYLCKADSGISKGSTGTASLYVGASGSETDSTVNITSCRAKWMAIATSKWCGVSFVNGVPYITQLEC